MKEPYKMNKELLDKEKDELIIHPPKSLAFRKT